MSVSKSIVLAQCDTVVSNNLLMKNGRRIKSMVAEINDDDFRIALITNKTYKQCHDLLTKCYSDAINAKYIFEHDTYGGYGLVYDRDDPIIVNKSRDIVLPDLNAILQTVENNDMSEFVSISIFSATDLCRKNRIMVGPVRFANHSCKPNTEYVASQYGNVKCVKLKLLKSIHKGDQIHVFYGNDFFGEGNWDCKCPHVDLHAERPLVFSMRQEQLISANIEKRFVHLYKRKTRQSPPKKRRCTELRHFTTSDSLSEEFVDTLIEDQGNFRGGELMETDDIDIVQNREDETQATAPHILEINYTDTTLPVQMEEPPTGNNDEASLSSLTEFHEPINSVIFSKQNFVTAVNLIAAKHATPDEKVKDWISLMRLAFPSAQIPTFYNIKNQYHVPQLLHKNFVRPCGQGEYWMLNFISEIVEIVKTNLKVIEEYSSSHDATTDFDLSPCFSFENRTLTISLIMNSDGVRFIKSSPKHLWPVWLALANLPPKMRCAFKNIVLAALWSGIGKPDWDKLFSEISEKLSCQPIIQYKKTNFAIVAKVIVLVSDIPATASMLNMNHHRAKYGCTLCLIDTKTEDRILFFHTKNVQ